MAPLHRPPPRPPVQQPVTRRLSTRSRTASQATTIRTRGSSSRSIIINGEVQQSTGTSSTTTTQMTSARARKAKETQLSLGVGRPTAASSARSRTLTRSLRLRASRSSRLAQEAIAEGTPHILFFFQGPQTHLQKKHNRQKQILRPHQTPTHPPKEIKHIALQITMKSCPAWRH